MSRILIEYEIEDGYAGGKRPHTFYADSSDFYDLSESEITDLVAEMAHEHMLQKVSVAVSNLYTLTSEIKATVAAEQAAEAAEDEDDA